MSTTQDTRACASCAAFGADPDKASSPAECWNLVSIATPGHQRRAPRLTDSCDLHQTHQEDAEQTAFIDANRDSIMTGIRHQVTAERCMRKIISKVSKAGAA
jgi:hypothetical protein